MYKLLSSALIVLFGMTILSSCTTNTEPTNSASLLTIEQISNNAGYAWFDTEKSMYAPDDSIVRDINQAFKNKNHKVYFFVNPSCSCDGTKKTFPHAIRILQDAGVPSDRIVIYSLKSYTDDHPLKDKFQLRGLPSIFITVNDEITCKMDVIDRKLKVRSENSTEVDRTGDQLEKVIADGFSW